MSPLKRYEKSSVSYIHITAVGGGAVGPGASHIAAAVMVPFFFRARVLCRGKRNKKPADAAVHLSLYHVHQFVYLLFVFRQIFIVIIVHIAPISALSYPKHVNRALG